MLRDLLAKDQSRSAGKANKDDGKPAKPDEHETSSSPAQKDDEDFVPVSHQDAEDADDGVADVDVRQTESPRPTFSAGFQRIAANLLDFDDDSDHSFLHPLMGHFQNRLLARTRSTPNKFDPLHPFTQILSLSNVEDCVKLENETFPENERCSREKFIYRLTKCPELSLGIFSRPTLSEAANSKKVPKAELIGHIIATRTSAPCVTDATMEMPPNWRTQKSTLPVPGEGEPLGHQDEGRTICLHSLAVAVQHQNKSLGTVLLKAYTQRIRDSKTADRIALLAHGHLVKFYSDVGFQDMGASACTFGGGGWNNMILDFTDQHED